jgi:peptidoglycan/xylan/chitin deacetylase (PgdA/CDA1 family)
MGSVVVSVDAELGWGHHDLSAPPRERVAAARRGWETLVALFDEFDVPATWAVVGHLFLSECDGHHADHPAPDSWFAHEHGPDALDPALRYAPDLVAAVRDADAGHEIGCHTFSHVEFGDPATPQALARAELAASVDAAREFGVSLSSFVFPRNRPGHRAVLAEHGFCCYRGVRPGLRSGAFGTIEKLARATVTGGRPPLVEPTLDEFGLVDVPASLYLYGFEGVGRDIIAPVWGDPVVRQARRGIDAAAGGDGVFHVWLHPNNLVGSRHVERLRAVLEHLAARRADGDLRVETMHEVAERVRVASSRRVAGRVK